MLWSVGTCDCVREPTGQRERVRSCERLSGGDTEKESYRQRNNVRLWVHERVQNEEDDYENACLFVLPTYVYTAYLPTCVYTTYLLMFILPTYGILPTHVYLTYLCLYYLPMFILPTYVYTTYL